MKVNIIGKGVVPGLGVLAPINNVEVTKEQTQRIINYNNFKVYGIGVGLITRSNINSVFERERFQSYISTTPTTQGNVIPDPVPLPNAIIGDTNKVEATNVVEINYPDNHMEEPVIEPEVEQPVSEEPVEEEVQPTNNQNNGGNNNNQRNNKNKHRNH